MKFGMCIQFFFNKAWKTQKGQTVSDWMDPNKQACSIGKKIWEKAINIGTMKKNHPKNTKSLLTLCIFYIL